MNDGIIFGGYAAYLWIKDSTGKELEYSKIDIITDKCNYPEYEVEDRDEYRTLLRDKRNRIIKIHHVLPDLPIQDVELLKVPDITTRIETKKATRIRMEHDLKRFGKLVSFWKDYYPDLPDIVHISFEMDMIRNYLKYL